LSAFQLRLLINPWYLSIEMTHPIRHLGTRLLSNYAGLKHVNLHQYPVSIAICTLVHFSTMTSFISYINNDVINLLVLFWLTLDIFNFSWYNIYEIIHWSNTCIKMLYKSLRNEGMCIAHNTSGHDDDYNKVITRTFWQIKSLWNFRKWYFGSLIDHDKNHILWQYRWQGLSYNFVVIIIMSFAHSWLITCFYWGFDLWYSM
jgi:ABC-type Fe3+-siderophore transport system permease subunit